MLYQTLHESMWDKYNCDDYIWMVSDVKCVKQLKKITHIEKYYMHIFMYALCAYVQHSLNLKPQQWFYLRRCLHTFSNLNSGHKNHYLLIFIYCIAFNLGFLSANVL